MGSRPPSRTPRPRSSAGAEIAKIRSQLKAVIDNYNSVDAGSDLAKQAYTEIDKVRGK
jgi:hypothetical protein